MTASPPLTYSQSPSLQSPSRFVQRWLGAAPEREQLLQSQMALSLPQRNLAQLLHNEITSGLSDTRAMRRLRNLLIATLIERDLNGQADLAEVVQSMTEFADFAIQTLHQRVSREMQALYGPPIGEDSGQQQELIVLGMGKLGGGELNVSSDIDLIFTYAEDGDTCANQDGASGQKSLSNHEYFIRLGKKLIAALAEIAEDGFCFRVDMALRPNGASGPLVASFNMVEEYLIVQGREWERYAWVKARAITGRASDIATLEAIVRPFVYRRYLDYGVIDAIRNMHGQIRAEVTRQERLHPDRSNNVKLGRGGIREIEFLAQVFQLIRGGRDHGLRLRSTRLTLRALAERELLKPEVVEQLLQSYTFLRNLEHRLQYLDDAQTHTLPANEADRNLVAQMMGLADSNALLAALAEQRQFVAEQFDAIFSDKNSSEKAASSQIAAHQIDQDNHDQTISQLQALGFTDPKGAAQRLHGMWQSSRVQNLPEASRTRLINLINSALPLVQACSRAETTLGLLLDFLEIIARRSAYLSLLTEYPYALSRVVNMMNSSTWAATFLNKHPIVLDELLDGRILEQAPNYSVADSEVETNLTLQLRQTAGDTERQMDILRETHHSQLFRLLAQDLAGMHSVEHLADHLSALADCIVRATLPAAWQTITQRHIETPRFAVIAYGRLGGKELGYVSDLDVIFLFDDDNPEAQGLYAKLAQRFITWMTTHTAAGILFDIDTALRPDGASGMLVSSLSAFERYQTNSAWAWEHQALSRARFCAGDASIGARFEQIRENVLRKPRDPEKLKADVVAMRKKMRTAYANRSPLFDLKHDEGGMIDIEFIVQYMVLRHAHEHPELCANIGNIALLKRCADFCLIAVILAHQVGDAYRLMRKLQHQIRLQGEDKARVPMALVEDAVRQVRALWALVLGNEGNK